MSSLNYLELCRLCLVKDRVHIGIFEGEGEVRQIFLKIAACLPVKVRKDDRLPKQICDDCLQKVELLYQFWNQTANAEKQLLEWLGETVDDKTVETNVKHEHMEQDAGSELANSLSRVEAVLAEAREHESSDNDHFGDDSHKPETDSDDEPLSSLEPTQFINVNLNGSQSTTAQTQEEFLAPSAPSTSKSNVPAAVAQAAGSGIKRKRKKTITKEELTCQICGKIFRRIQFLRLHILTHNGEQRYSCEFCTFTSNYIHQVTYHIQNVHEKRQQVSCEHCQKTFFNEKNKKRHILDVHGIGAEAEYHCEECGAVFTNHSQFTYHKRHKHKPKTSVYCELCDKFYTDSNCFNMHVKRVHSGNQRCPCSVCGKILSRDYIKAHMAVHKGIKNHVCEFCGKRFSEKPVLRIHRYTHTGEKPHSCSYCGKGFTQHTSMMIHKERYHSEGQDCILCTICQAAFATKEKFSKHWQKHKKFPINLK